MHWFFLLKRYIRFFLLCPQKCMTHQFQGCSSTFSAARTVNTRSNWIMASWRARICGLLSGFSSRQLQKQQHHILTSVFFFDSVCNAAYLHSASGFQSVSDSALITSCCRTQRCATSCVMCDGHDWFWDSTLKKINKLGLAPAPLLICLWIKSLMSFNI